MMLKGTKIADPANAVFDPAKKGVTLNGELVTETMVAIGPASESYGLFIGKTEVTLNNFHDISAAGGFSAVKSGAVIYDPLSKTLTLDNAVIEEEQQGEAISNNRVDGLNIVLKGNNELRASVKAGLSCYAPTVISGSGRLTTTSEKGCGIYATTSLTIRHCFVKAIGRWGIAGQQGTQDESLTIEEAVVCAEGSSGSICDFGSLTLNGSKIYQPDGAAFDPSQKGICSDGDLVRSEVNIVKEKFGFNVATQEVTPENYTDITASLESGTVTYDPSTNTLTLDNAVIDSFGRAPVRNITNHGLTVVLKGYNELRTAQRGAILCEAATTIEGPGKLTAKGREGIGIYVNRTDLTIRHCEVVADGDRWGIKGVVYDGGNSTLTIDNAIVRARGNEEASIKDFSLFTLKGCEIIQPSGGVYDYLKKGVSIGSGYSPTKDWVIISNPTSLEEVTADVPVKMEGTYNLQGMKMRGAFDSLPKGVYIHNGKKVVKK